MAITGIISHFDRLRFALCLSVRMGRLSQKVFFLTINQ
uniref:Uncharacterized protein n=1 Tax=Anguilla anguilla TaxID=7936 RepID=A0A0E9RCM6_ANGAN